MGSFTDVVLSIDFRRDTPPEVLASFSALQQPTSDSSGRPAPLLPEPVAEPDDGWVPDWRDMGDWVDPLVDEPWRHDWASWLRSSMSADTIASAALVWGGYAWNLTFRTSFKAPAESVVTFLDWLGPYVLQRAAKRPELLGFLQDDNDERPRLIWCDDGHLVSEDLN